MEPYAWRRVYTFCMWQPTSQRPVGSFIVNSKIPTEARGLCIMSTIWGWWKYKVVSLLVHDTEQLCADTGCSPENLLAIMDDREGWQERVRDIRANGATWWWWPLFPDNNGPVESLSLRHLPYKNRNPSQSSKNKIFQTKCRICLVVIIFFNSKPQRIVRFLCREKEENFPVS